MNSTMNKTRPKFPPPPATVECLAPNATLCTVRAWRTIDDKQVQVVRWDMDVGRWIPVGTYVTWEKKSDGGYTLASKREKAPSVSSTVARVTELEGVVAAVERRLAKMEEALGV